VSGLNKAYFLDVLGDSYNSLGRPGAAIEVYHQAAQAFREQSAQYAYALCLFKIAESYRSLDQADQAIRYLETCLPLLRDLGLSYHEKLALRELSACRATLYREQPGTSPLQPS
jgi:tetratricopeptide (TPR) repeat protein